MRKDGFWSLGLGVSRRCVACRCLHLTMDMSWEMRNRHHKTVHARIRLLLFESKSRRLSTAVSAAKNCLGEVQEMINLKQNCWELE